MTRQAIYDRLRAIGVTVESADAVAEALEPLPGKKVEAFLLWLCGYTYRAIGKVFSCDEKVIRNIVKKVRKCL